MNVKAVVKVMNFHSLLRVESARRAAEKYGTMEDELESMIGIILNNKNLQLDKKILLPKSDLPELNIYLGSDFGFCGSVNSAVSSTLITDSGEKIIIGKKLRKQPEAMVIISQEELDTKFEVISEYLSKAVRERKWSKVNLIYNHYYNLSSIKLVNRCIYPLTTQDKTKVKDKKASEWDDFSIEGDPRELIEDMLVSYLIYEVKIAASSAYASENIMRQNATSESLKKMEEIEEEELRVERKERNAASFKKTVDSYVRQKALK